MLKGLKWRSVKMDEEVGFSYWMVIMFTRIWERDEWVRNILEIERKF